MGGEMRSAPLENGRMGRVRKFARAVLRFFGRLEVERSADMTGEGGVLVVNRLAGWEAFVLQLVFPWPLRFLGGDLQGARVRRLLRWVGALGCGGEREAEEGLEAGEWVCVCGR
ncbi:MAG: hypothetical protein RLZZ244_1570, partial [Verrucomicrobiota bacterium]